MSAPVSRSSSDSPVSESFKRPGSSLEKAAKRRKPDMDLIFEFVRELARKPYEKVLENCPERSGVYTIRELCFVGPAQNSGVKVRSPISSRKKIDRPCSPTIFSMTFGEEIQQQPLHKRTDVKNNPQSNLNNLLSLVRSQHYTSNPQDLNGPNMQIIPSKEFGSPKGKKKKKDLKLIGLRHYTALGALTSPLHRPTVEEQWSSREIALFESGMCTYGKRFYSIAKLIPTKTTQEVIDFYYVWKKSESYKIWKRSYSASFE